MEGLSDFGGRVWHAQNTRFQERCALVKKWSGLTLFDEKPSTEESCEYGCQAVVKAYPIMEDESGMLIAAEEPV